MQRETSPQTIDIQVTLNEQEAWHYAQYLKRICWTDYRLRAMSDPEAYTMLHAGERIREALAQKGYAPR